MRALQMPFDRQPAVELSTTLWRKQILPVGSINYEGRDLHFTPDYLQELANAFNGKAYDHVPFVLADPANAHNMDPERFRGDVLAMEVNDEGLFGVFRPSEAGAQLLKENPNLGVSARIVPGLEKSDGRKYPVAIQHVLGTLDPRVTGMKPWEAVNLATEPGQVIDLTAATITPKESTMTTITDEQRAAFDAYLNELGQLAPAGGGEPTETVELDPEIEQLLVQALADETEDEPVGAALSAEAQQAIDLANAQSSEAQQRADAIQTELDEARWDRERGQFLSAGVPPAILDLAAPVLNGRDRVIELSTTETLDAGQVVRSILEQCKGIVDLSGPTPAAMKPTDEDQAVLDELDRMFPA